MKTNLTSKQIHAAGLIALGMTKRIIAEEVGVTPQTISVWSASDEFEALINQFKMQSLEDARDRIRARSGSAVDTIRDLMDKGEKEAVRLQAARTVLDVTGISNPERWAFGIGPTSAERIKKMRDINAGIQYRLDNS